MLISTPFACLHVEVDQFVSRQYFFLEMIPDLLSPVVENKAWLLCQSSMPGAREKVFRSTSITFIAIATREDVT